MIVPSRAMSQPLPRELRITDAKIPLRALAMAQNKCRRLW
jgi:hypothetical protein